MLVPPSIGQVAGEWHASLESKEAGDAELEKLGIFNKPHIGKCIIVNTAIIPAGKRIERIYYAPSIPALRYGHIPNF